MAEGALFDLAGKVINVLGSFIAEEVKLAFGVKTEIENLKRTVSAIQAVILDAEMRSSQDDQIKDWLSKLKDVFHDADDLLDDFSTQVLRRKLMSGNKMNKEVRLFFSSSNQLNFNVKMGRELKAIKQRLNATAKDKEAFHLNQIFVEPQVMNRGRQTDYFVLKDEVIGRENDKEEIMKRLFDDSVKENISIIPIVGIGGLGKTTLAQLVFHDEDVKTKFEIKLWVCISDIFDVQRIVKEILEQLGKRMHVESLEILQNKLREELNGKKYLIVLDDLWNEDNNEWCFLRSLLMVGATGSRILVTTRSSKVAEITGTTSPHQLKGLAPEEAWSLFVKMAFKEGKEPKNRGIIDLGKKIVEKCIGVPLAIRTIGSLLYGKTNEIEWQSFLEGELSKVLSEQENVIEPQVKNRGRETYSFVLNDEVIGRENDKEEIMKRLFDDRVKENISIIPIVGIGGLGKTTLAQLVFNDEDVKTKFEIKLWVCISDIFDVERIVKEILEQLGKWKHVESLQILQNKLGEELNGKKYLIVLDDLWNEDDNKWRPLRSLLMVGATGSRILVTTRSSKVAEITGTTSPHQLKGLAPEKAWSLFVKMAFKEGKEPKNRGIIDLGKKIVEKCFGVPLAIRTIGSILYGKTNEIEWQSFLEGELSKVLSGQENVILLTLKLSYDRLPSHLKKCFAYCSLFPKGYRINVYTLVNLWVANQFIVLEGSKQRFEDVGREYFMKLLWRSFFHDVESDGLGNIKSCKMNNLMRELAVLVSETERAIFNSSENYDNEKVRHVSLNLVNSSMRFSIPMHNGSKVRTVLISSVWGNLGNLTCDALISNLKYLRALDLSYLELHVVPRSIGELKHLKYLDLSGNYYIKILPNSITKMLNLQTLILESCHSLGKLPGGIKKLVNLRYLDITNCDELTDMPLEIRHLTSLEIILPCLVVRMESSKGKSIGASDLKELHNLGGELRIENLGHGENDARECEDANLKDKHHLQQLSLKWDDSEWNAEIGCYDEMSLEWLQPHPNLKWLWLENFMGVRIPTWVSSLTNLVYLVLRKNRRLQHLPPLNQLPFLKYFGLVGMEALEYISDEVSVSNVLGASSSSSSSPKTPFFPSLSSLVIRECPELKGWWRNSDDDDDGNEPHHLLLPSFPPCLSTLRIQDCPNLTSMPPFPYLKERLKLSRCSWKVLKETMEMGASYCPLTQLEVLSLKDVGDLELLPQEICNLTSLKELRIYQCPKLTSLPQEIRNLTSLKILRISGCPLLGQRCEREVGEDWRFIAHVPFIEVDGQKQQEETIS